MGTDIGRGGRDAHGCGGGHRAPRGRGAGRAARRCGCFTCACGRPAAPRRTRPRPRVRLRPLRREAVQRACSPGRTNDAPRLRPRTRPARRRTTLRRYARLCRAGAAPRRRLPRVRSVRPRRAGVRAARGEPRPSGSVARPRRTSSVATLLRSSRGFRARTKISPSSSPRFYHAIPPRAAQRCRCTCNLACTERQGVAPPSWAEPTSSPRSTARSTISTAAHMESS